MSDLYVLRHGIAEPRRQGRDDKDRALTKEGREKLGLVLKQARAAGVAPAVILTSPLVRAVETAEMAARILAPKAKVVQTDTLVPGSSPQAIWDDIRKHARKGAVLISGHEPLLGESISFLLGVDKGVVDLKKGALACVDVDASQKRPGGALQWLITPRICQTGGG